MQAIADLAKMAVNGSMMEIEHRGVTVLYTLSMFKKDSFDVENETFAHINKYWATLPMDLQDKIFACYQDIAEDFDSMLNRQNLKNILIPKIKALMDLHDLKDMEDWVKYRSEIPIPEKFTEKYVHNVDKNTTEDKTFTRPEYVQLMTGSVALRAMVPIWGSYIKIIRGDSGNVFKEQQAFQLLREAKIYYSPFIQKLYTYIVAQVGKDEFNAANTLNFISSEDYPKWLLSLVCVKRLCIGDIRFKDPKADLTTLIYNFIIQKVRFTDSSVSSIVKTKRPDTGGSDESNKFSNFERFKAAASISLGQITEIAWSMEDIVKNSLRLCPEIDPKMLEASITSAKKGLAQAQLLKPQLVILGWVFSPILVPRGVDYLTADTKVEALGALEAILWTQGHRYLSVLCSSYALLDNGVHRVSQVASKMRNPEELTKDLREHFPYVQHVYQRSAPPVELCATTTSINLQASRFGQYTWRATADDWKLQEVFGTTQRRIPIRPDIKTELTRLVIALGSTPK